MENSFFKHINQAVILIKSTGEVVYMNDFALDFIGTKHQQLSSMLAKDDYVKVLEFISNGNGVHFERRVNARLVGADHLDLEIIIESWKLSEEADFILMVDSKGTVSPNLDLKLDVQKVFADIVKTIHQSDSIEQLLSNIVGALSKYYKQASTFLLYNRDELNTLFVTSDDTKSNAALRVLNDLVEKAQVSLLLKKDQINELISINNNGGGLRPQIWCGIPLRAKNKVIGSVGLFDYSADNTIDEHDLKILELLADQIYFALEFKVSELNLMAAKQKAEQSDNLKSAFLANMSHEIRTPMNSIVGFGGLLLSDHVAPEDKTYYYKQIKDSSNFLMQLIEDIIDISRIETGDTTIITNDFNFHQLLAELFSQHKQLLSDASKPNIEFKLYKPLSGELRIHSDQKRIRQIFKNLLSNAIKFTEEGQIEFGYEMISDNLLQCYVKDTGVGINQADLPSVFNSFTKVNESKTKIFGGTGIGLSICKQVVEMLGGNIWADSQFGMGSTFFFTIPIEKAHKIGASKNVTRAEVKTVLDGKKVLIAEDNVFNYELLSSLLRNTGAEIMLAQDGLQTVRLVQNNPDIWLLLLDIRMPGLDGLNVAKRIRAFNTELRIVAQTAYAFDSDRIEALAAGCNEFVVKPINQQILFNKIYELFS